MPRHKKKKRAEAAGASTKRTDWLVGDLVVAKLRGHRPWPAQIQKPEDYGYTPRAHRIFVTFYGTEETCFCSYNKITPFTPAVRKGLAEQLQKINTNPELERAIKEIFAADDEHKLSVKSHASHSKEDELAAEKSEEETPAPPVEVTRKRGRGVEEVVAPEVNAVEYSRPAKHEKSISTMAVEQVEKLPRKVRIKVSAQTSDSANQQAGRLVGSDKASVSSIQSDLSLRPSEASAARGKVASKNVDSPTTSKVGDSSVNSYSCVTLKANGEDAGDEEDGDVFIREVLQNGNEAAAEKMEVDEGFGEEFWKIFDDEGEQRKNAEGQKPASMVRKHPDRSLPVDIASVSGDDPPRKVKDSGKLVPRTGGARVVEGLEGTTAVKERVGALAKEDEVNHVPEDLDRSVRVKEQVSDTVKKVEVRKVPEELDSSSSRNEEVSVAAKEEKTEIGKVPENLHSSAAEKEAVSLMVKEDEVIEVPEELHSSSSRKKDVSPVANKTGISEVPEKLQSSSGDVVQVPEEPKGDGVGQVQEVLDGSRVHNEHVSVVAKTKEDEVRLAPEDSSGAPEKDDVSAAPEGSASAQKEQVPTVAVDVEAPHVQIEVDSSSERQEQKSPVGKEEKVSEPPELKSRPKEQVSAEAMEVEISVVPTSSESSNVLKDHVSPVVTDVEVSLVQIEVESTSGPKESFPPVKEGEVTVIAEEASVDAMQVTQEATQVPVKITEASEEAMDVEVSLVHSTLESSIPQKEHVSRVPTVDDVSLVAMDIEGSHVPLESDSSSLQKEQITPVAKEDEVIVGPEGLDNANARKEQVSPEAKEGECIRLDEQGGKEVSGAGSDNKNGLLEHQVDVAGSTNVDEISEIKKLATSSRDLAAGVEDVGKESQAGLPQQDPGKREGALVTSVVVEERVVTTVLVDETDVTSVVVEELIKEPSKVNDAEPPAPVVEEVLQQEEPCRSLVLDGETKGPFVELEADDFKHVIEQKPQEAEPLKPLKEKVSELVAGAKEQADEPPAPGKQVYEAVFAGKEVLGNAVVSETEQVTEALALGKEQLGEPLVPEEHQGVVQHVALQQQDAVLSSSVEEDAADKA